MNLLKRGLNIFGKARQALMVFVMMLVMALMSVPAFAEGGWTPTLTVDTDPVFTVAGIVVTAIGAIWCIRKVVKLGNHS